MMRARVRLAFPAAIVLMASTLACPSLDDPSGAPRLPDPPTAATTPRPVVTATATAPAPPTAAPTTPPVSEPTRDPRGTRCMACSNDSECRPPLRCFPFTDGRSRCDNANPGPPC